MLKRRVSVRDVAAAAAVSSTTASMVLNGHTANFPAQTRERVLAAAERLGYRPNRLARNLVCESSELVGVVVQYVENPLFASLSAYLNRQVAARKHHAIFQMTELNAEAAAWRQAVEVLLGWRVAGILHWWDESYAAMDRPAGNESPVVYFGSSSPGAEHDSVSLDDYAGAKLAAEHMLALGHRRIGHLSRSASIASARTKALTDAMTGAGLAGPVVHPCAGESAEESREAVRRLMDGRRRPTALFCHNDVMAFGAVRGLRDLGLSVPGDVSVVGFDDIWAGAYMDPPLTTVVFPYREIVDAAVELLFERIAGRKTEPRQVVLPGSLVVRGSTAPPVAAGK